MSGLSQEQINADLFDEVQRQKQEIRNLKNYTKEIFINNMFNIAKNDRGEYTLTLSTNDKDYFFKIMKLLNGQTPFNFNISSEILNELAKRDVK